MGRVLDRIGETLGLTQRLVDLQKPEPAHPGVVCPPLRQPPGVHERQAELDRKAVEAAADAQAEKLRIRNLVEATRSLQAELQKAEKRFREISEWLDGFTAEGLKAQAAEIGAHWGQSQFGDGPNPHWIRGLAECRAVLDSKAEILAGNRRVLDEVRARMSKHIEANRADLTELGFFENASN